MLGSNMNTKQSIVPKKETCRSLFGPVDHDEIRELLRQQDEQCLENAKATWNFDFVTESPLPGRFQWDDAADGETTVPSAYELPGLSVYSKRKRDEELDLDDEHKENVPKFTRTQAEIGAVARCLSALSTPSSRPSVTSNGEECALTDNSRTVPDAATTSPSQYRQSTLTEFFASKKNHVRESKH